MMGTDSPQLFDVPGFALHREIAVMSEAGMTKQQILESGTATVGRYVTDHLKITRSFGTVSVGQRADLVLLGSNPLDDLDNLNDRVGVMIRGRWVPKAEIDSGLAALAAKHPPSELVDEKSLLWFLLQPSSSGSAGGTTLRLPLAESI
jgi:hypothetical protein